MSEPNANIFKAIDAERRGTSFQEVTALMNMVATILFEVRSKTVKRARDLKESAEMHRTIYRAIRDRNPAAARDAMRDHLMLAQKAQEQEEEFE